MDGLVYRYEVQYWTYEQALELPFGLRCCSANGVFHSDTAARENPSMECEWLFCFDVGTVEVIYPSGELHWFCAEHCDPSELPTGSLFAS